MVEISTLGLSLQSILQIRSAQAQLSDLSTQLSTGKKSLDLSYYSLTESRRILDLRGTIERREAYQDVIGTTLPRLQVYNNTFDAIEEMGNQALLLVNTTQNSETADNEATAEQISGFLDNMGYYLNQKVGDRYIFAGSRYSTAPVTDLTALPVPPTESSTPVTDPAVPTYDVGYPANSAASYVEDSVTIDDGYNVTYGISSNESGFQNMILGLRWAYAATQDEANFSTYMATARDLIATSLDELRGLHGDVASDTSKLEDMKKLHTQFISEATSSVTDIQYADSAEVATKITFVQAQLQASYSATARIAQMSLVNYL